MKTKFLLALVAIITMTAVAIGTGLKLRGPAPQEPQTSSQRWGKPSEGFQLSAQLGKQQVSPGEPITLKLTIRNTADRELALEEIGAEQEYKLDVRNGSGERVAVIEDGQRLIDNEGNDMMVVGVRVASGQERTDVIEVSRLYHMADSGTYRITAKRKVHKLDRTGWTDVVSNTVTVLVR